MASLIVTEAELRRHLPPDAGALAEVENAFTWMDQGRVSMPPVMHIDVDAQSAVDVKGAFVRGVNHLAVKIATGFFENPKRGLPSCSSTIVLLNAETGHCDCVFLDNGYLMDLRTGLAGAVAAKHLAPIEAETVGVIGTGVQARYQIESLALVRSFSRVLVFGRTPEKVAAYCADMGRRLGIEVIGVDNPETLVRRSQIVVTTTQATEALIAADWVGPGTHITAMGSDLPGKQELDPQILQKADLVACDSLDQCLVGGELQHMLGAGIDREVIELGAMTSGRQPIARVPGQITICDLTGTGAQDTAIAVEALRRIRRVDGGITISCQGRAARND